MSFPPLRPLQPRSTRASSWVPTAALGSPPVGCASGPACSGRSAQAGGRPSCSLGHAPVILSTHGALWWHGLWFSLGTMSVRGWLQSSPQVRWWLAYHPHRHAPASAEWDCFRRLAAGALPAAERSSRCGYVARGCDWPMPYRTGAAANVVARASSPDHHCHGSHDAGHLTRSAGSATGCVEWLPPLAQAGLWCGPVLVFVAASSHRMLPFLGDGLWPARAGGWPHGRCGCWYRSSLSRRSVRCCPGSTWPRCPRWLRFVGFSHLVVVCVASAGLTLRWVGHPAMHAHAEDALRRGLVVAAGVAAVADGCGAPRCPMRAPGGSDSPARYALGMGYLGGILPTMATRETLRTRESPARSTVSPACSMWCFRPPCSPDFAPCSGRRPLQLRTAAAVA